MKDLSELPDHIDRLDDLVDGLLNPITDLTDTMGDLASPLKATLKLYQAVKLNRYKYFIKSYSRNLKREGDKEQLRNKLKGYLSNEKNRNFIYEIIDAAMDTNSVYCTMVLGYLTSGILLKEIRPTYIHLSTAEFLRNINDFELDGTIELFEKLPRPEKKEQKKLIEMFPGWSMTPYIRNAVRKLKTYQMIDPVSKDDSDLWFMTSDATLFLIDLIKESGVKEEMKD